MTSLYHWVGVAVVWSNIGVLVLLGSWQLVARGRRPASGARRAATWGMGSRPASRPGTSPPLP